MKIFDDVIVMLILRRHQNTTAKRVEYLKKVQLTFTGLRQSSVVSFEIKSLKTGH